MKLPEEPHTIKLTEQELDFLYSNFSSEEYAHDDDLLDLSCSIEAKICLAALGQGVEVSTDNLQQGLFATYTKFFN
mgnify:CR=1 FL=1|tara:strand:- start:265 stop:492 length:228 start_codon:yes stop_codon:yes gene_type:complete